MRKRTTGLFLLCVLLAVAAGWYQSDSDDTETPELSRQNHVHTQSDVVEATIDRMVEGQEAEDVNGSAKKTEIKPQDSPIPNGHWRLTGHLVNAFEVQHSAFKELDFSECTIWFAYKVETENGIWVTTVTHAKIAKDGGFSVDARADRLKGTSGEWAFSLRVYSKDHPLRHHRQDGLWASNQDGTVDEPRSVNILRPKISGELIQFGQIPVSLAVFAVEAEFLYGRILHSSGNPVSNWQDVLLVATADPETEQQPFVVSSLSTDAAGWFFARLGYEQDISLLKKRRWHLVPRGDWGRGFSNSSAMRTLLPATSKGYWAHDIAAPEKKPHYWDVGTVQVGGGLVDIEFAGVKPEYLLDTIGIVFYCGDDSLNLKLPTTGGSCVLQSGQYRWLCHSRPQGVLLQQSSGVLNVELGQQYKLVITLEERPTVLMTVKLGSLDNNNTSSYVLDSFYVRYFTEDSRAEKVEEEAKYKESEEDSGTPVLLPMDIGTLKVQIGDKGFEWQDISVPPNSKPFTILLVPLQQYQITFKMPTIPPGMDCKMLDVNCRIEQLGSDSDPIYIGLEIGESPLTSSIILYTSGLHRFLLYEGDKWGYPDGVITTKDVRIGKDEANIVEFGSIPSPPFKFRSGGLNVYTFVAGKSVTISAEYKGGGVLDSNRDLWQKLGPIIDGEQFIEPTKTTPQEHGAKHTAIYNLPHRITVTGSIQDEPIDYFFVDADSDNSAGFCHRTTKTGEAKLWLPPGKATLKIKYRNQWIHKSIEVLADQVTDVHFKLDACTVVFKSAEQPFVTWLLHKQGNTGELEFQDWVYSGSSEVLTPGTYVMVAPDGHATLRFTVSSGEARKTVNLPEYSTETGDLFVKVSLPHEDNPSAKYPINLYWTAVSDDPRINRSPHKSMIGFDSRLSVRITKNGLLLKNVPVGRKICILGGSGVPDSDTRPDALWAVKPFVVELSASGETVSAESFYNVRPAENWWKYRPCILSLVEGISLPIIHGLPTGRHQYAFFQMGKLIHREWITVPAGTVEFGLPKAITKRLDALRSEE